MISLVSKSNIFLIVFPIFLGLEISAPVFAQGTTSELLLKADEIPVLGPTTPAAKIKVEEGLQFIQQGRLLDAIRAFQAAVALDRTLWQGHYNLGLALQRVGDLHGAAIAFYNTTRLQPDFALPYANIGGLLLDSGNINQAEVYLNKAIALAPNLSVAYYNLGLVYRQQGKLTEAIATWEKAQQISPDILEIAIQLSEAYINNNQLEKVEPILSSIVEDNPKYVPVHYLLGRLRDRQGKPTEALAEFRQVTKLDGNYANAYYGAAQIFLDNNRPQEARPLLEYAAFLYQQQGQTFWANKTKNLLSQQ